ncbi:DEAD/DEAH box helicase [Vibrio splendidus]|uniref:DEAD/DEAH box helicase n=1 Tax=Vibrio splendidus TaxID=29497 RepID=UPI002469A03F|nr:ATP-binding domain-containing protein [Vibrio splendidus]MDH5915107.1 ATP-binding domain-containing protein [Vibrio splendidus]
MNIIPKSFDLTSNPEIHHIIQTLQNNEDELCLQDANIFLEFPLYKDDDSSVIMTQILVVSPCHGVLIIYSTDISRNDPNKIAQEEKKLDKIAGHITSKLFKNDNLRAGLMGLSIPVDAVLFARNLDDDISRVETKHKLINTTHNFLDFFKSSTTTVAENLISETISSLQGAKGLLRPANRPIEGFGDDTKVAKVHLTESKILKFDNDQQDGYIPAIDGPHRIRGLAGSGKTVILTMKVVQTLLRENDRKLSVLYTFSTKSLYQHVKRLIHRFFREFDDDMSYLDCVNVLHAWGGSTNPGVYYNACKSHGVTPLTLTAAKNGTTYGLQPFEFACKTLLESTDIKPIYDYVFVDEAQDYGKYYLQLCTKLAKNSRVTFGADVFQNIFQPKVLAADEIFGPDLGFKQDDFLETCYRTPLAILVAAHAIGLGVYGEQVQAIESVESWKGFGYDVLTRKSGQFSVNELIKVRRSEEKSPTLIGEDPNELITYKPNCTDTIDEAKHVANQIVNDIKHEGLLPEDILVISVDDRSCAEYFNHLTDALLLHRIPTNNVHANKYSINDFQVPGRVTLSTIHKAKGNEAYSVYVMGCDALCHNLNIRSRNLLFTAMTRTKGWLHLSGYGSSVTKLFNEIDQAKANSPEIHFQYPSETNLQKIRDDLKKGSKSNKNDIKKLQVLADSLGGADEIEKLLAELRSAEAKK